MSGGKYIGLDVHQATISVAVVDSQGKLMMESILETKASTILEFVKHRKSGIETTLKSLNKHDESKVRTLLNSLGSNLSGQDFLALLDCYFFWNQKEAGLKEDTNPRLWRAYEGEATALAETIFKSIYPTESRTAKGGSQEFVVDAVCPIHCEGSYPPRQFGRRCDNHQEN